MAKEKFERSKSHCNIGAIGHVDYGKTILTVTITIDCRHKKTPESLQLSGVFDFWAGTSDAKSRELGAKDAV